MPQGKVTKLEDLFKDGATPTTIPEDQDPFAGISTANAPSEEAEEFFGGPASDDEFVEDFTGETSGTRMAPEGLNRVRCTNVEQSKSKKGDPMYVWDFTIVEGEGKGITLKLFTSLSPTARWKVIETLEGLGIEASNRVVKFKKSDVVNKLAYVEIVHEEYNGRMRNSVQRVLSENDAAAVQG